MKFNNNFEYISKEDIEKLKNCKLNHSVNVRIKGVNKTFLSLQLNQNPCPNCFFYKYCDSKDRKKYTIPCCDWERDDGNCCIYKEIK